MKSVMRGKGLSLYLIIGNSLFTLANVGSVGIKQLFNRKCNFFDELLMIIGKSLERAEKQAETLDLFFDSVTEIRKSNIKSTQAWFCMTIA